jgi:phenylalanine-4-hydroxylase
MKADMIQDMGNPTGHGEDDKYARYIVDQGHENYTDEEHGTWTILFERQSEIVKGRACDEFFEGQESLGIDASGIPNFDAVNEHLAKTTGWEVCAVEGIIPDLPFFKMLSERKFPAGNFIRKRDQLDYIQEPDVFHDVFGHVPLLSHSVFADYLQEFGKGGAKAHKHNLIPALARLYWYTVEFGLISTPEGMRIYGAGILSSPGETVFSLENPSPNRLGFELRRVMRTEYRVDDYQQTYFAIESFQHLMDETRQDFAPIYEEMKTDPTSYPLTDVLENDKVFNVGTQEYAAAKAKA